MSRFWEIVFRVPLLFRRHVCLSKLKHSPSRAFPLTARKTVFSHLKQPRRRQRQRERKKNNRLAKQQLCTCITPFNCTFVCRHCTTTTWECLISRFVENVNTRQRLPFSFSELWYTPLEFNSRKVCQHLTNWTRWNKRDKIWSSANLLFSDVFVAVISHWDFRLPSFELWIPLSISKFRLPNFDHQIMSDFWVACVTSAKRRMGGGDRPSYKDQAFLGF